MGTTCSECVCRCVCWCKNTPVKHTHLPMHTHTHTHVYKRIDVQIHTHMHMYTYIHVRTHTQIHVYTHTHTKCKYERMQARLERQRDSERAKSRCSWRKLCTSLSFDAIKPHFAPPMQGLHCNHVLEVNSSKEAPSSFTMAPRVVVERLEGKQRCSRAAVSQHAGIQAREWSNWLFTRNEGSMKNNQPPQAAHHANHDSVAARQHPLIDVFYRKKEGEEEWVEYPLPLLTQTLPKPSASLVSWNPRHCGKPKPLYYIRSLLMAFTSAHVCGLDWIHRFTPCFVYFFLLPLHF